MEIINLIFPSFIHASSFSFAESTCANLWGPLETPKNVNARFITRHNIIAQEMRRAIQIRATIDIRTVNLRGFDKRVFQLILRDDIHIYTSHPLKTLVPLGNHDSLVALCRTQTVPLSETLKSRVPRWASIETQRCLREIKNEGFASPLQTLRVDKPRRAKNKATVQNNRHAI
jgi:hypothetical protein